MSLKRLFSIVSILAMLTHNVFAADLIFPGKDQFFFGVSNAPSQVEDQLDDIWMQFARDGHIPAFDNFARPEERIGFWTNPEVEIKLAKQLGTEVFRLGVDWQRLMSKSGELDKKALARYKEILQMIHANGMKVMLTLFHHTEPFYTYEKGSWRNKTMIEEFRLFWRPVLLELNDQIDYLVTFNEAQIYVLMSQVAGIWPHAKKPSELGIFNLGPFKGRYEKSLRHMATAHKEIYDFAKNQGYKFPIGIAHNMANYGGEGLISVYGKWMSWQKFNYRFTDLVADKVDYMGINYYGIEVLKGIGVTFSKKYEYSDSGRGINPEGLYKILKKIDHRYNVKKKGRSKKAGKLPVIITENGVADELDWYRPLYLSEHLAAIHKAMQEGVQVLGYIQWTLTDNFEWADGYCPKFGLSGIDRDSFERQPRGSFDIFRNIINTRTITQNDRDRYFGLIQSKVGQLRPMCRGEDGKTALRVPRMIPVSDIDWRFKD